MSPVVRVARTLLLALFLNSLQDVQWLLSLCLVGDSLLRLLLDSLGQLLVSLFSQTSVEAWFSTALGH